MNRRPVSSPGARRLLLMCSALTALLCPLARAGVQSCTVTATGVAFGTYTPLTPAALTTAGTIKVKCTVTGNGSNTITINLNAGASNSFTTRTMINGVNTLNYNLYLNAANTQIWGDGTGGSVVDTVRLTGSNSVSAEATVYGAVAASQDPAAGSYTDTILVTVNY